ncbi:MAG: Cell death protease [Watsoniomyces obsoletus]|nr:MAG: Cell death protease [Watsoniomyces obsoletus]
MPPPFSRDTTFLQRMWIHTALLLRWSVLVAFIAPSVVYAEKTAADYYVHNLPGAPDGPLLKMHAGHIEVDSKHNGHLFFWHYQNRHIANRQRTVIWLNGGPGCSSMDGALMEVGPYRLKDDHTLRYNDGSWDEFANLLFVDQPVGTGFSYVNTDSYLHELNEMADEFIVFLEKFFHLFPQYETDDIYMAGESYAGQHIPYIAQAILERNKGDVHHKWNLQGLLIGNGWISPVEQYQSYLPMAYEAKLLEGGSPTAKQLESQQAVCNSELSKPGGTDRVDLHACEQVLTEILKQTQRTSGPDDQKCANMYDYRLRDSYPSCGMNWPPDLKNVTPYLRRPEVIKALHVDADKKTGWTECQGAVGSAFKAINSKPAIVLLPGLLEHMPIVLFSGAQDLICNHLGTEDMIHNMAWNGGKGFELSPGTWAPRRDWTFEGQPAGIYQEARNLTYILFYNASHMVPFDWPRRSRDMFDRFAHVDIASIGGSPADSRIDGEKGLEVSVGGHPNSTVAKEREAAKVKKAKWDAYYRSGEVVLVLVIFAAGIWGWFIWRARRRDGSGNTPYYGLLSPTTANNGPGAGSMGGTTHHQHRRGKSSGVGLERFRRTRLPGGLGIGMGNGKGRGNGDLEAADFDESELDNLRIPSPREGDEEEGRNHKERRYDRPDEDGDERGDVINGNGIGRANGKDVERFDVGSASSDDEDEGGKGTSRT